MMVTPEHLFCFGLGYSCLRLVPLLQAEGWRVSGTTRSAEKKRKLEDFGVDAMWLFGGDTPIDADCDVFEGVTHLISSIPPGEKGDPALLHHKKALQRLGSLRWVAYLSTPAVYGDRAGAIVHEDDEPRPGSERGARRLAAEKAWVSTFAETETSVQIFRLSGIYGPGRSVVDKLQEGTARIIDKPGQVFNRIHVDDIGTVLRASMERPRNGRIYNVADDEACESGAVIEHAAHLLEVEPPARVPFEEADLSPMARSFYAECKRLNTSRLKKELGVALKYPTYREGLEAIIAETNGNFLVT